MSRKASLTVLALSLALAVSLVAGVVWQRSGKDPDSPVKQMGIMVEVYQHIADDYVTTPNLAKVSDGGLHGLLESLDADSSYLDPAEYKAWQQRQDAPGLGNIQAVISRRVGYADVVDVQPGGDAAKAGLVRGDFVEAINGQGTRDLSMADIDTILAGAPGSTVTLSVVHMHRSVPVDVVITRVAASMAPLKASVENGVGVIHPTDLESGRATQIAAALRKMQAQGVKKIVLDLRDCGAGSYSQAEKVANLFLQQGTITYLEGQKYPRVTVTAKAGSTVDASGPLEVLTDYGTFGPAEVVAAALQQNHRAKVIGDATFGEGSVQKMIPLGDGSAVWLTVARYYTPSGKLVEDGITPDVQQVRYAGALPDMDYAPPGVTGVLPDLQMQKAMALLQAPGSPAPAKP